LFSTSSIVSSSCSAELEHVISQPFPAIVDAWPYPSPHGSIGRLDGFYLNRNPKTINVKYSLYVAEMVSLIKDIWELLTSEPLLACSGKP
jgi:hypothetical protein